MVENHLEVKKKVVLEDVEILMVLHRLEEVVILEAEDLTDVLQIDPIEILAEEIESLLVDSEENVEKVNSYKHQKLKPHKHALVRFFFDRRLLLLAAIPIK